MPGSEEWVRLADLVASERRCCAFFCFAITVDHGGVGLEIEAAGRRRTIGDRSLRPRSMTGRRGRKNRPRRGKPLTSLDVLVSGLDYGFPVKQR